MSHTSVKAAEWAVDADVLQSLSYDDNVILREEAEGSFIYNITPIVSFYHRTDSSELTANASYGYQHFFDIPTFNREHQEYGLDWQYNMDRLKWGLATTYSIAPSRDTAEEDSGDSETDADKTYFFISPSVSYQLTELDRLSLSANYSDNSYSTSEFADSVSKRVNLTWSHKWTNRLRNSVNIFYSMFDSDRTSAENPIDFQKNREIDRQKQIIRAFNRLPGRVLLIPDTPKDLGLLDIETISYGINFSMYYSLSEKWEIFGGVGGRLSETEFVFDREFQDSESSEGFLFDAGFQYTDENLFAELSIKRSLIPSSNGSLQELSRYELDMNYSISERLSAAMLLSYQETEQVAGEFSNQSIRTNIQFQPSISWRLDPDWTISGSYRYHWQERTRGEGTEIADSNMFMVSVNYNWQGLSIAR